MDEETLIARANEERLKMYERYDKGREGGAEIDPWEDPTFEIYHQTDRYGFIHDKRLPQRNGPNEEKAKQIELERVKKWLKMEKTWDSKETAEKIRKRVYKGIPDKLRSRFWLKLLNMGPIGDHHKDIYQNMLKLAREWSTEARQIDSDVNRQFREHLFFRERYSIKQKSLFNVLTAYSMYNMEVGYCQGMSGIAGVLLMYMDEVEAFWALSQLLSHEKYAMHGLYIEGFPKLTRFLAHHDRIVTKFLPKVKNHFDHYNLDSILYSLKWFFVVFVERIPFNLCLRVWDIYLLDGERVVTAMAYTILRMHKTKLLKLKDMDLIVQYLQTKLHKDFGYDDDSVIKALEQSMDDLRKAKLDLPPPGAPNEFPKQPFGIFREPTVEAKTGIRKSTFSNTEKEVTDNVILRRDIIAQELEESRLSEAALNGSNSQLNTGHHTLESEDGGSLLGSSRKSLADTSVTSTADLSVFSGGQRSHHAFDICLDDTRSINSGGGIGGGIISSIAGDCEATADGGGDGGSENSPGSAFGSLSVVGRTASTMMITPTPRAMSPQDIVRIYVPAAPMDEPSTSVTPNKSPQFEHNKLQKSTQMQQQQQQHQPQQHYQQYQHRSYDVVHASDASNVRRQSYQHSDDENIFDNVTSDLTRATLNGSGQQSTSSSSSRRGSMSRKSPSFSPPNDIVYECSHIRTKRGAKQMVGGGSGSGGGVDGESWTPLHTTQFVYNNTSNTSIPSTAVAAASPVANNRMSKSDITHQNNQYQNQNNSYSPNRLISDDEEFTYSYYSTKSIKTRECRPKYGSDYNIHYEPASMQSSSSPPPSAGSKIGYKTFAESRESLRDSNGGGGGRRRSGGGGGDNYGGNDDNNDDDDEEDDGDDDEDDDGGDESSPSPNSKSILTTPVNESAPLIMSKLNTTAIYNHNQSIVRSMDSGNEDVSPTKTPISSPTNRQQMRATTTMQTNASGSGGAPLKSPTSSISSSASTKQSRIPLYQSTTPQHMQKQSQSQSHSIMASNTSSVADSRIAMPIGGPYEFASNRQPLQQRVTANTTKHDATNKIRIKIQQNDKSIYHHHNQHYRE